MHRLLEIFFLPPMAIARVGSSPEPLESFRWVDTELPHHLARTVIEPAVSLRVEHDGTVTPYLPRSIPFKDGNGAVRPVAPFFELWARVQDADTGEVRETPVTPDLLADYGRETRHVTYEIHLANRKAARRTDYAPCAFIAREVIAGDDHRPRELLAASPHGSGQVPLVSPEKPIPIGRLQVLKPSDRTCSPTEGESVDCRTLRLRFTPPKGLVYGPPEATSAPAPLVQPGETEAKATLYGRIHEIVAPANRILSSDTPWSSYVMLDGTYEDPQPQDGYDGASVGDWRSWGCVDDVSDGTITATLSIEGRLLRAVARVMTGPPDFAPDRRPVFSVSDDIADRERDPVDVAAHPEEAMAEVLDLFCRAFETASHFNLDALRTRALMENRLRFPGRSTTDEEPKSDERSMTADDTSFAGKLPTLVPQQPSIYTDAVPGAPLPYTSVIALSHARLQNKIVLKQLLRTRGEFVKKLMRPPFGSFGELPSSPSIEPASDFRDARVARDLMHDMRMPPYMRDANRQPLSITRRQYRLLLELVDHLQKDEDTSSQEPKP